MKDPVRFALLLMCLLTAGMAAQGQTRRTESSCLVMYDPTFWKSKLHLREEQCRSIRQINAQYYERLVGVLDRPASSSVSTLTLVEQYLSDRNEKIWSIFQPAQRKRWKRLWDHQYAVVVEGPQSMDHSRSDEASSEGCHWAAFAVDRGLWTVDSFSPERLIQHLL